jgi:Pyridoxamine 5'-phosphate oxidase
VLAPDRASVDHGRVVFTHRALPAIRLVNRLVDEGRVIVRTRLTATVFTVVRLSSDAGVVVAYEADDFDPERRAGWSVVVTGWATTITNPEQVARYEQLLHPWANMTMDAMIAIQPEMVTDIRIIDDTPNAATDGASELIGSVGPATTITHTRFIHRSSRRFLDVWIGAQQTNTGPDLGGEQALQPARMVLDLALFSQGYSLVNAAMRLASRA